MAHGGPSKRKPNNNIDDNNSEDELPAPPDGGWGWVIVAASFLIHIITDGITYSFGIMYVELLGEFKEGKGYTSWILSLMSGMTLCSGPISSSFVNKYGCRAVTIAGAILASACLLVSVFAQNVFTLIITIGFGVGCGLGLIYLPAIVSVTTYFEKYRSVATGIAVAGSGLGTFIFAPLIDILIQELTWRGTLLVLSGIVLNCAIFGAMFRPLKASTRQIAPAEQSDTYQRESSYEIESMPNNHQNGHGHLKRKPRTTSSVRVPSVNVISEVGDGQMIRSQSVGHSMAVVTTNNYDTNNYDTNKLLNINYCNGRPENGTKTAQNNGKSDGMRYTLSQPLLINSTADSEHENKPLKDSHKHWRSGTLSRPDIFYQGSLYNIPNYRSHSELPTDVPDRYGSLRRVNENEELCSDYVCCGCIPADTRESFIEMMNFNLLKDPIFVLFTVSNFATSLGFYVPYFCLADQAKVLGMTSEDGSWLLAAIGIANTLGRLILGYISDKSWVNRLWVYNCCLVICGVATAASTLCIDFWSLIIYSAVFGFTIGAYVGLTSVILVDLLGLDKLTNAFGLLLLFQGIATFVGPPIVGFLYDQSHSYTPGFVFAGAMIALSGLILFFIPSMQRYYAQRELRSDREESVIAS
ncbi:monocarboxylate transporter 12-like [Sitodiplosis mosellana]|uniref:monocarboxylate transporter 12-like n=1 Tax=Sitodiplosis mosellana TaxID=263140 RepID=UPI0024447C83|nr:monocarboxylate transporter 12-like [Sitodiplosis mosellana]